MSWLTFKRWQRGEVFIKAESIAGIENWHEPEGVRIWTNMGVDFIVEGNAKDILKDVLEVTRRPVGVFHH